MYSYYLAQRQELDLLDFLSSFFLQNDLDI